MIKEAGKKPDFIFLASVFGMLLLGILVLSSASAAFSQFKYGNSYYLIGHQLAVGVLPGLLLAAIAYRMPLRFLRKSAPLLLLGAVILLIMIFVPGVGFSAGGARRWIHLGFATIQPSEVLKPIFIVYLSSWLAARFSASENGFLKSRKKENGINDNFTAFLAIVGLIGILLIGQPDMSTFGIVALTAFGMYFLSGAPLKHILLIAIFGAAALIALVCSAPYRFDRLTSWRTPEADPLGKNFQSNQALIIVGSGGVFGQGLGSSSAKYTVLPELIGDSVFAPLAHEIGFAGGVLLVVLFWVFIWRAYLIAQKTRDRFEYLVVWGVMIWINLQTFINVASTMGLIPLSGVPLPFISYGGTAMAAELAAAGLIFNISRRSEG